MLIILWNDNFGENYTLLQNLFAEPFLAYLKIAIEVLIGGKKIRQQTGRGPSIEVSASKAKMRAPKLSVILPLDQGCPLYSSFIWESVTCICDITSR